MDSAVRAGYWLQKWKRSWNLYLARIITLAMKLRLYFNEDVGIGRENIVETAYTFLIIMVMITGTNIRNSDI